MNEELLKVEWFDDRFYKTKVSEVPEGVPDSLIYSNGEDIYIYAPSVTTIIQNGQPNKFLDRWRGTVGNDTADWISLQARTKGSNIHEYCAVYSSGGIVLFNDGGIINEISIGQIKELNKILENGENRNIRVVKKQEEMIQVYRYEQLWKTLNPKVLEIEKSIFYSKDGLLFGGTIDYVWDLEGGEYNISKKSGTDVIPKGRYIVDIKTGNSFETDNYAIQVSAYAKAYGDIDGAIIVHLNSDNKTGINGVKLEILNSEELEAPFKQFVNLYNTFVYTNRNLKPNVFDVPVMLSPYEIKLK